MKKFVTFLSTMVLAIVSSVSAFAQPGFSPLADDGNTIQYLYNVEADAFLKGGNDWGTRASLVKTDANQVKVSNNGDGTWTLMDNVNNSGEWQGVFTDNQANSIWVDNAGRAESKTWVITSNGDGTYTIKNKAITYDTEACLASSPSPSVDTRIYFGNKNYFGATWAFVSEADYAAYTAKANAGKSSRNVGDDISSAFPTMCSDMAGWTITNNSTFHLNTWSGEGNNDGSSAVTPFIENWVWAGNGDKLPEGTIAYKLTGLVPGQEYEVALYVRAFNEGADAIPAGAYIFAGEGKSEDVSTGTVYRFNGRPGIYGTFSAVGTADENGELSTGVELSGNNFSWIIIKHAKITVNSSQPLRLFAAVSDPKDGAELDAKENQVVSFTFPRQEFGTDPKYTGEYIADIYQDGKKIDTATGTFAPSGSIEVELATEVGHEYSIVFEEGSVVVKENDDEIHSNPEAISMSFRTLTLTELAVKEYEAAVAEADALSLHASTHIGVGVMLYLPAKVAQYKKDLALAKSLASDYKIYNDYKEGTALINFLVRELQPQYPDLNQRYLVQHKASGLYLNADDGVKLNSVPTPVAFHHVEGAKEASRYFMYSTPDREYICYEGSNPWTMTNKTVSIEGGKFIIKHHCDLDPAGVRKDVYYSLVGMNGVLGSNADLAKDPGIYGDKKEGDANAQWLLIPYEEPDPSDMSVKPTPKTTALATDGNTIQYLYNADADAFFTQGNAWGTQASYLPTVGNQFKVSIAGGTTEIINLVPNKNNAWMNPFIDAQGGIYVDNGADPNSHAWSINVLEDGSFEITNTIVATDKKVGIDPAEKKNIIQMTNAEGAYTKWFAVSEEDFNAYVMARLAYDKWVKENTTIQPGDDVTYLADGAAFTSALGTPGTVADWAWSGHEGAAELYNQGAINAGDVLVMSLSDIQNGVYDVTLEVAASFTPGRGFEAPVGEGLAEAFANSATEAIEVFERESVGADGADVVTLTAVVTDGTLKFGVRNLESAGNWFLCDLKSIVFVSKDVKSVLIKTPEATEISSVSSSAAPAAIYSVNGAQLKSMQKGMNIVKMADGQVKKVLVK